MDVGERTRLGVQVLGDLAVAGSGARPLGGPTQRRAFAALVVHRNETTTIDQLVDACWPDGDTPKRAEHNVRTYVHRLRGALGEHDGRIETTANGYKIRLEPAETDIDRFEQLAGEAGRLIDVGEPVAALDRLDDAESLWHGRPYAEFADEPWVEAEVARLDELHRTIGERRAEALLTAGRPADAVGVLERLVRDEPYRERPRALLMRALYESGRPTEALRAFQEFRRFLIDDAGVEPSPDLVELDRRIAGGTLDRSTPRRRVGNYELHERIGEGAFAVVHRATQASLGREVAVKIVRAELANQPEFIRRFEAEAQMVAAIEHPNVVPLYDYWREPGNAYLVMRWMTGGSLEQKLDDGPLDVDAVVRLVDEVAAALDAAHACDVVHRDVKPANILFDDGGRALLGDFGIALAAEERSTPQAALSEGSPVYASPEQLRREPVGPEADVHALAIVAFTALAGRTPFHDTHDDAELLRRQLTEPVPAISTVRPGLPLGLDDVIATATAKRPVDRYPTAGALATAFRSAAGDEVAAGIRRLADRSNPYLGLRAFTEVDAALFHGRSRLVDELVAACADPGRRLLTVVGPSGSGKSSVVRAGLVPALRSGRVPGSASWFLTTMVPGPRPYEALETALLRVATNPPSALLDQLRDGDRGIHRAVSRIVSTDADTVLVVIDQLEELFTVTDEPERQRFLRALTAAVTEPGGRLRVVATLRADFFDQPLRHPAFAPVFKVSAVAITPLAPDELEEAITAPAAAVGVGFEPGLVAEIIADVNSQPGALPLLQYALTQAFDATDDDTISIDAYHAIGGLSGALGRRAEDLYLAAADDEQQAMRRLFGRLVSLGEGTDDTRRRIRVGELPADDTTQTALDHFGRARLLTFDRDPATREPTVEIAHEALIREWPRLRRWLDDDRDGLRIHRHLTETAAAWIVSGRDDGELYRSARLDAAIAWVADHERDLNADERDFLAASSAAHDRELAAERAHTLQQARANRRLRRLVVASTAIAVAAVVIGVVAVSQARRAADERDARDLVRLRAESVALAERIPQLALLLAVEADRADPSIQTKDALHQTLTTPSPVVRNHLEEVVRLDEAQIARLDDPGARLHLALRQGGDIILSAVESPNGPAETVRHERTDAGWRSYPTGRRALVAGSGDHTLWIDSKVAVVGPSGSSIELATRAVDDVTAFAISRGGEVVALAFMDGTLELFGPDGDRFGSLKIAQGRDLVGRRVHIDISDDGSLLALQVDGELSDGAWLVATTQPAQIVDAGTTVGSLDILTNSRQRPFISGSRLFVSPPQTNYVYAVQPDTVEIAGPRLIGHTSSITDVALSESSGLIATASLDGSVRVWDSASGRPLGRTIEAHPDVTMFDDRSRLVVPHGDHISVWNYDVSTWQDIACEAAQRNLTRAEWDDHGPRSISYRRTCDQYPIES